MQNTELIEDHLRRAKSRIAALETLFAEESWPDVVRESQEVVELVLKALLRSAKIAPPRVHDVSEALLQERERMPAEVQEDLERLAEVSRQLRRDRELAFYGSEDLTPSHFYKKRDAEQALKDARWVYEIVRAVVR